MLKNKKNILLGLGIFVALFLICLYALRSLFAVGLFAMHDDEQVARLYEMFLVITQGQIPPRWVPDLGFGFGYPLFNFYPPFVYYLGAVLHLIGFSFINSTKLVMGFGFFLSAAGMFVWVRKHFGIIAGLFAAVLYTYAPYHSVDLYVRGALAEFFAFVWIPLLFWGIDSLFEKREKKYVVFVGLFFALLMLTHTLVMLQFAPIFLIYVSFQFFFYKKFVLQNALLLATSLILGLGLSAYFWLPSILEKQFTLVDMILTKELANYALHFVCPAQLLNGIWGYGGSGPGCLDGLSFQIGKVQIVVGLGALGISLLYVFKRRLRIVWTVLFVTGFSVWMTIPLSKPLWDMLKPFWYIQFPWRYLLFVAVGTAFLGGFVVWSVQKKWGLYAGAFVAIVLSLFNIYQVRNDFQPQSYRNITDAEMTSKQDLQWRVSSMSYEYVPKEVQTQLSAKNTTKLTIEEQDLPKKSFTILSGDMKVVELENSSQLKRYTVTVYNRTTAEQGLLQINTFLFPGWLVYLDGREVTQLAHSREHLIRIEIPAGRHTVVAVFTNTPVRTIANVISLLSILGLVGSYFVIRYKKT